MALKLLLESDIGLMSLATIGIVIGMGVVFVALYLKKTREPEQR